MENQRVDIRKISSESDEYALLLYMDDHLTEFASELGRESNARQDFISSAKQIIKERYPSVRITVVKVILGGMVITSIPITTGAKAVSASENSSVLTQVQVTSVFYQVESGDTLWNIARKFNTKVDHIKRANNLTSDRLQINQKLIIPQAFHTVATGDYLSVLAKKYGTTVEAIKEANNLTSDSTRLGQMLIIPAMLGQPSTLTSPTSVPAPAPAASQSSSYSVVAGDSMSVIAKRFGTTVEAIKNENGLTSDFLRVGQVLTIPSPETVSQSPNSTPDNMFSYSVISGDSLSDIAMRYGTTVAELRNVNQLSSDLIRIGQVLTIPKGNSSTTQALPPVQEEKSTFVYSVRSGDNLSTIANRFGVTVDALRTANDFSSDVLQIGQTLTIPNGINDTTQTGTNTITHISHTVISGDTIWGLSVRYGLPQSELLRANNLTTSSTLSIGQKLTIPVHNIATKPVVSEKHGEYLDWWTEAQYVFTIDKTAKVTDFVTGKSFYIKRTIGANHADSETLTINDSTIAKSIWGGYSWKPRAVILEIDGRKVAASMSFMPHEREYIKNNGITGHFDVYFGNSTRHIDGKADASHQVQVEKAAGIQ